MDLKNPKLEELNLHITNRCNFQCKMCDIWSASKEELSLDKLKDILNQARNLGAYKLFISGGEPLMREDLFVLLEYANHLNFYIWLVSNGSLINEKVAKNLSQYIDGISISIEGSKELHETVRGEGTFEPAVEAIRLLRKNKILVTLCMVVSKISYPYMRNLVDIATEVDANYIYYQAFQKTTLFNRVKNCQLLDIAVEEIPSLTEEIEKTLMYAREKNVNLSNLADRMKLIPDYYRNGGTIFPQKGCKSPFSTIFVQPKGHVVPCPFMTQIADVNKSTLETIWRNELFQEARKKALNKECPGCFCYREFEDSDIKINIAEKFVYIYRDYKACGMRYLIRKIKQYISKKIK